MTGVPVLDSHLPSSPEIPITQASTLVPSFLQDTRLYNGSDKEGMSSATKVTKKETLKVSLGTRAWKWEGCLLHHCTPR